MRTEERQCWKCLFVFYRRFARSHRLLKDLQFMQSGTSGKYGPYQRVDLPDRQWPNRRIETAPIWCSVDLRDGNQALAIPMDGPRKLKLFKTLVDIGFKQIEVGFPSASETEYAFTRKLIEDSLIPEDVYIQVLTQAREHLIKKTFESLKMPDERLFTSTIQPRQCSAKSPSASPSKRLRTLQ